MTDDESSSPTKYDGYSAYLSSLSSSSTFPHNTTTATDATDAVASSVGAHNDGADTVRTPLKPGSGAVSSPPFTPSTPSPPPPLPPRPPSSNLPVDAGSFAEAVRPLERPADADDGNDDGRASQKSALHERGTDDAADDSQIDQTNVLADQNIQEGEANQHHPQEASEDEDGESEAPEWEDFMAHYWNLPTPETTSDLQIHAHAASVVQSEDFDLKPCPMEPELDEEPFLCPIRTGCIDIDMDGMMLLQKSHSGEGTDFNPSSTSPMKELSNVGLECSRLMAKLHGGEIGEEALSITTPTKRPQVGSSPRQMQQQHPQQQYPIQSYDALQSPSSFDEKRSVASNTNTNKSNSSDIPKQEEEEEEWPHRISPLPSINLIHAVGPILTRTSLRSLVMKKWHPSYWMHYGPHTLLLFRSKEHLDDWRYNPYHGKKQREYLVKVRIDFYGEMVAGERDGGGVLGHRCLSVKRKNYGKNETEMYQFKLERWTNLGVSVLAAFASQEETEVLALHDTICKILKTCPYGGLRNIDHMLKK